MREDIEIQICQEHHLAGCFALIEELALFEKAPQEVTLSLEQFKEDFNQKAFEAFVAIKEKEVLGMALYFFNYSTWKGRSLYLEDIVVKQSERRKGLGRLLFKALLEKAKTMDAGRFAWQVLDWNKDAIEFYKNYPVEFEDNWLNVKIRQEELRKL